MREDVSMLRCKLFCLLLTLAALPSLYSAETPSSKAWKILAQGIADKNVDKRAKAVQALGLLPGQPKAEQLAVSVTDDKDARVRTAAVAALGQMKARSARSQLVKAIDDPSVEVAFAAADSLSGWNDPAAFDFYYAILSRERKAKGSLIREGKGMLQNPKELEKLGFEQGIGFIPYASLSLMAFRMMTKDDVSPARAIAARKLAKDHDPKSGKALVAALGDSKWIVRAAAAAAIAERNNSSLLNDVIPAMDDANDLVSDTAAAAVVRLSLQRHAPATKSAPGPGGAGKVLREPSSPRQ